MLITLKNASLLFAYSLTNDMAVKMANNSELEVPTGHLFKLSSENNALNDEQQTLSVSGENMIIVQFMLSETL